MRSKKDNDVIGQSDADGSPCWVSSQPQLQEWYSSDLGQSILAQLIDRLDHILPTVFGYQGLQLGALEPGTSYLERAGIHRPVILESPMLVSGEQPEPEQESQLEGRVSESGSSTSAELLSVGQASKPKAVDAPVTVGVGADEPGFYEPGLEDVKARTSKESVAAGQESSAAGRGSRIKPQLTADVLSLPIDSDVMKLVIMPHTLDFCSDPYQALREADRVLTNDGHLIIVGFSRWSLFGARRLLPVRRQQVPWNGRFFSRYRVSDWLSVLNYKIDEHHTFFLRPPLRSKKLLRRLQLIEKGQRWLSPFGAIYVLHARKQTIPLTPAKRLWLPQRGRIKTGALASVREVAASREGSAGVVKRDKAVEKS